MTQIPDEAVVAALEYYSEGGCMGLDNSERKYVVISMLEAALPYLTNEVTKPFDVAAVREAEAVERFSSAEQVRKKLHPIVPDRAIKNTIKAFKELVGSVPDYIESQLSEFVGQKNTSEARATIVDKLDSLVRHAEPVLRARPLEEWHEDHGNVVWWAWDNDRKEWFGEPAYIGKPLDSDWPEYHTHWTPHPAFPAAPTSEAQ